jgi:Fe2+ or Zn2+ uptake regulation protein
MFVSKNDYKILKMLLENGCKNKIKSLTINDISQMAGLSIPKVRVTIKLFLMMSYVNEGATNKAAKTYYITSSGINELNSLFQ